MDISEYTKCANDFVYFCEKYIKIKHPIHGFIKFELYDFQKNVIKEYENERFVLLKKFRQGGFSTLTTMYALWDCIFGLDRRWLFITTKDREAIALSQFVKNAISQLPYDFRDMLTLNNDHRKNFGDTNSEMMFFGASAAAMKGKAVTNLVIDEAAFIPNMDQLWTSLYPMISTGGKVFALSTVNGKNNWFYEEYRDAAQQGSLFKIVDIPYTEHPVYQQPEFVEKIRGDLGEKGFRQEIEGQFEGSAMNIECEIFEE